jgi:SAM-dependent methyltransferase
MGSVRARRVAFLGMPAGGELTPGAARGFYRASAGTLDVQGLIQSSSLLATNMNALWVSALNRVRAGERIDYFAMIHSDIEPEEFWLDKLTEELEAGDFDVLGVASPIKDQRGVTSIAVGRDDGDNWRPKCRLTMTEIHRLPETFTSADVGGPLLLNTGLWVCRFRESWAKKVCFTINDRLCFDPKRDRYFVQVEPEDWYVSRLFHELGLKVGCTRKVELGHRGHMSFGNVKPWGENTFDREYVESSTLPGRAAADWFPHDVPGWLTEAEGRELARLAEGKVVLEVGSYCGRSTVCLAKTARNVAAVDTFDGRGTAVPGDTLATFKSGLARHGVAGKVNALKGASESVLPTLPPIFDLAFIDGSHDAASVRRDAELAAKCLRPGGLLAFHDFDKPDDPGVAVAVGELLSAGAELVGRVDSLAVVRPAETLQPVGV